VCPTCSLSLGAVVAVGTSRRPRRGNYAICHNCGELLRFAEGLALEKVDILKANVDPDVLAQVYKVRELVGALNEEAAARSESRAQRRGFAAQIRKRGRLPS
jgi:hypothetical protein